MSIGKSQKHDFPIVGSFGEDVITKINAERTINWYEVVDEESRKGRYLAPWPGLKQIGIFSEGILARASIVYKGFAYFVVKQDIYRVDTGFVITRLTTDLDRFLTSSGHVGVAANEKEIAFVDNSKLLLWNPGTTTLTDATAALTANNVSPLDITSMDGYFIVVNGLSPNTDRFYISHLNNGTLWDINDFALVNSDPIILSACSRLKRRLFLFGQTKSEIWLDAGAADFPFRRDNNLLLEHGIIAPSSLVEGYDRLFYLANEDDGVGGVMMVAGTAPTKVSTREIDEKISLINDVTDAIGSVFKISGEIFYMINFTSGNKTFVYNVNNNKWHELEDIFQDRYIVNTHVYYNNKHLVAAYNDNRLYEMSPDYLTIDRIIDGKNVIEDIKRTRIAKVLGLPTYVRFRIDRLQVDLLQGVGLPKTLNEDKDPVLFLSISQDGGVTYENFERQKIGKSGERTFRTIWRRLGVRRDAIIKIESYNKVPYYVFGASIDIEVLPE